MVLSTKLFTFRVRFPNDFQKYIPLVWEVGSDMLLNVETYRIKLGENAIRGFDSLGNIFSYTYLSSNMYRTLPSKRL